MSGILTEDQFPDIQGNILAGFNKDNATFLFFALPAEAEQGRVWLSEVVDEVATTTEVKAFNALFKEIGKRHRDRETVQATWMNLQQRRLGCPWC
jgi:hypothetical protein